MRTLDQLPSVLHDLARHPNVSQILKQPTPALVNYLSNQAWPEDLDEEAQPETQQAEELASLMPTVETFLDSHPLPQMQHLAQALETVHPGSKDLMQRLMPLKQPSLPQS